MEKIKESRATGVKGDASKFVPTSLTLGRGLDIGTANLVCAARTTDGETIIRAQRNAFMDIVSNPFTKNMLTKLDVNYVVSDGALCVLGDPAFEFANIFNRNMRRPMKNGFISPDETDALPMIKVLVENIVGHPREKGDVCYFSIPAEPVDMEMNVVYHKGIFQGILRRLGYTPRDMIEGHAVVFSELADEDFTGIGISCGGGLFNVCVCYKTVPAISFSISRGGDWIDENVARVTGIPVSRATFIKERGVDLTNPRNRVEEAVAIYYRNLITYTLDVLKHEFKHSRSLPTFPEPIVIACSGGTTMIEGFEDMFREEFEKSDFPIEVKEIRRAADPLNSVARGLLVASISEK
jgi:hypothetical protein